MNNFEAPPSISDYNKYLEEVKLKRKFETRGLKNQEWEFDSEYVDFLKKKSSLNLGEFFKAYTNEFGFGYQKMYKIIKAHKKYLMVNNLIVIKQKPVYKNKKTNATNKLEIIVVNKSKQKDLCKFLEIFR